MKAIETVYNGYKFRSRLEARWAVFFDTLGIKYEYEKEGFDLDGTWYLPDFWLPKQECWIEIKGEKPSKIEIDCIRLLTKFTRKSGYILWGSIPDGSIFDEQMWEWYQCGEFVDSPMLWAACPRCKVVGLSFSGYGRGLSCSCDVNKESDDLRIQDAYAAARQARFEHGAHPDTEKRNTHIIVETVATVGHGKCGTPRKPFLVQSRSILISDRGKVCGNCKKKIRPGDCYVEAWPPNGHGQKPHCTDCCPLQQVHISRPELVGAIK